ncbi:MAG TPA: FAD-dependent oxidoreductase [Acetobacteraceae bacterium]|nr:FAD-dependent oxidoreductase [Acetobacteraceae bacterium]
MTERSVTCCIAGGGPAGMMAGFLLARAGVEVLVLEKHADFLRDFRGDTIHPSTLQVMDELGLLDEFLRLPHQKAEELVGQVGDTVLRIADFRHLPTKCKFIAFMPQWDFLDFLADHARRLPKFGLMMRAEAEELIEEGGRVVGLRARTAEGDLDIRADLVIGADGRRSTVRAKAGLVSRELGAPIDVLWFRIARRDSDPNETFGRFDTGSLMVLINRGDYWQCGYVIPKGGVDQLREVGLPVLQARIAKLLPFLADRVGALDAWDKVNLLTVAVDRLERWHRPGLLCIGDAAHAMSPVGGVGVNLAVQDAVATANILAGALRERRLTETDLALVQRRREFPARATQRMQIAIQNRVISPVLAASEKLSVPLPLRLAAAVPWLRRFPARLIGMGVRPEHVRSPAA